jgi:membrane protease subunit HflK
MNNPNPFAGGSVQPPDMEKIKKASRRVFPTIIGILLLIVLAANSIYTLNNGEEAVVTRFGKRVKIVDTPGLQFKLPFIDNKHIENVAGIRSMEFGFREHNAQASEATMIAEAIMLTGEESRVNGLVNADWAIQYRISDIYDYLFKVEDPEATLRSVTQAAYRRIAAAYPLDAILTDRKDVIMNEVRHDLQEICTKYNMGIEIIAVQLQDASPPDEVREAFLDVTMALEDKEARTNEAQRYQNEEVPRARGRAAAAINDAEAYRDIRVNEAHGTVARYKAIEEEYRNSPDVMRTRLYLEMIREVFPQIEKIYFLDQSSGSLLEILHLGQ